MQDWNEITLEVVKETTPYGFVVDHRAYWGIPISGMEGLPKPEEADLSDLKNPPSKLRVSIEQPTEIWTGGSFDIFATCTPPLFHAVHHKTDELYDPTAPEEHDRPKFEPRSEDNVLERCFSPRDPLPNKATVACERLFSVQFDEKGEPLPVEQPTPIDFAQFNTEQKIIDASANGYFQTRQSLWDVKKIRPLNAVWFVILKKDGNLPISRLGDGYRLWHQLNHKDGMLYKTGYDWKIHQHKTNIHKYKVCVTLSGNQIEKGLRECPAESIAITFEYEWLFS